MDVRSGSDSFFGDFQPSSPPSVGHNIFGESRSPIPERSQGSQGFQQPPPGYGMSREGPSSIHADYEIPGQSQGFQQPPSTGFGYGMYQEGPPPVYGDSGVPRQPQGGQGGGDAFTFGWDLFADLGLPYQAYVARPEERYSEDERDDPEPAPSVARPREEPARGGRRRRAIARGKRPVGVPVPRA